MSKILPVLYCILALNFLLSCSGSQNPDKIPDIPIENTYSEKMNLKALEAAIAKNPGDPENYYSKALILQKEQNHEAALKDINMALSLDSSQGKYYLALATSQRALLQIQPAMKAAMRAEALGLKLPEVYVTQGEIQLILRDYEKASKNFNKALKVAPYYAEAYFYQALLLNETGDTALAIKNLQTAIEQDPEYIDAYNQLASIYFGKRNYSLGRQYLQSGLRFGPNNAMLNYNMGMYYIYQGQKDSANTLLRRAVVLDKTLYIAHYNLGQFSFTAGNFREAASHFQAAINANPIYAPAWYYLALSQEYQGQVGAAIESLNKVLEINAEYVEAAIKEIGKIRKRQEDGRADTSKGGIGR